MQNGMEFRNGRLVVPAKGYYHLYGFLDLYQSYGNEAMAPGMPDSITMRFYKSNILKPDEEALIETFRPYERSANQRFMIYQSFLGADVELDAGDEVYLKVSNLTYIKNPSRNVFGLHMLWASSQSPLSWKLDQIPPPYHYLIYKSGLSKNT